MAKSPSSNGIPDYYARLQVHPKAGLEVIEAAFRALAKIHHPDGGGNEDIFKGMNEARSILTRPDARAKYDASRMPGKGKIVGSYEILEKIAEGGFGNTHKARHIVSGKLACIKFCSNVTSEYFDLLNEEAQAMWDLRHYAIPAVKDIIKMGDGSYALVMSYISGPTLEQVIEKTGPLEAEHVAWITERILNALRYIHDNGIVHGDIKPQNIIVQPTKHTAVLVDFGLSAIKPTSASRAKGYTELFAPPEQMNGGVILPESDFYSLGITMLYALSGGDESAIKRRLVPASVPDELAAFIKKLIVRDVLARPRWPEGLHQDDVIDQLRHVRQVAFGRKQSRMKPIPGF